MTAGAHAGAVPSVAREGWSTAVRTRGRANSSWMQPAAKASKLLYVSDYLADEVDVFSYPARKRVGTLTGLASPQGLCSDKAGDVWIANSGTQQLIEYAHGGTTPIATLSDPDYYPAGCSVDPKTHDLAVSNLEYTAHGLPGNVAIYAKAQGSPMYFSPPGFYTCYFVGYDDKGNLFVDGTNAEVGANGTFEFAELTKGAADFTPIALSGGSVAFPGQVEWDGKNITVGDQDGAVIYRLAGDTITGSTPLTGSTDVVQYTISGKTVVAPDSGAADVGFYAFPAGGSPRSTLTGFSGPIGSALSK